MGEVWLARQRSPSVAFLYPFLYIVLPIILLLTRYYALVTECVPALFLARTYQRIALCRIYDHFTAPRPPVVDGPGAGDYHASALRLPGSF